jgi:AI-2 transport protein TqsA
MTSPALSSAATPRRWGLPRGLIVLLGGAAIVIIVAGVQGVAWLIGPAFMALIVVSVTVTFLSLVFWAWLIGPLGAILAIPLTLLAKAMLVDVDPHAGWADALLRASATKPESPAPEVPAAAERSHADTELAATSVPSPHVEEPGPPSREPTTRMSHEF